MQSYFLQAHIFAWFVTTHVEYSQVDASAACKASQIDRRNLPQGFPRFWIMRLGISDVARQWCGASKECSANLSKACKFAAPSTEQTTTSLKWGSDMLYRSLLEPFGLMTSRATTLSIGSKGKAYIHRNYPTTLYIIPTLCTSAQYVAMRQYLLRGLYSYIRTFLLFVSAMTFMA